MSHDQSVANDRMENISSQRMGQVLSASPFIPSVTLKQADSWKRIGEFAERAGLSAVEVLLRTPHAEKGVFQLKENFPSLKVGLGTVLTLGDFQKAIDCGADFVVSPGQLPELLEKARSTSLAYLPGVMTPSEIMLVSSYGFWNAKLFPAGYLAEPFIKGMEGPYPHMKYCVAGGVSEENWSFFAQCLSVRSISGTWILPQETLNESEAQQFVEKLEEKHFQFAKFRNLL
ncbi:MAG: bifunctional 4-hydroxy-2-oxoglutarate aldolase/2-dehydro-3-deoxy-phosphogluconate aldolase [Oligoflexus sp.]|nr:bifunctional 4-hydroxy-2-oxoglutarate aldolase/2-dehydro-3-deoxy-phosphogluconate aldolase [Oligoflexus sp.]